MKISLLPCLIAISAALFSAGCSKAPGTGGAEALYAQKCAACHPDGGNVIRGTKGLKRADLQRNNIKTATDIVAYIRKPGPDMPSYDAKALSDSEAAALAEYIHKTFK